MKTITIAGGGLAGLATGLGLRRLGVPAVIHEAGAYPRHRVCGEFIAGLDDETITTLEIGCLLADAPRHTSMLWHHDGKPIGSNRLPRPAIGISRHALDARLARAFVDAGGELHVGSRVGPTDFGDGWLDTTGRKPTKGKWVGMKVHVAGLITRADLEFHLGRGAYVGASLTESGAVNVCGLFRAPIVGSGSGDVRFLSHLDSCGLDDLARRIRAASIVSGSFCSVAGLGFAAWPAVRSGVSLGDAAGMIPPFTGDGMSIALQGAAAALEPLREYSAGAADWGTTVSRIRAGNRRKFGFRMSVAALLHPFLLHRPGQFSLSTLQRTGLIPFGTLFQSLH